jgi:hypothetical protein
MKRTAKKLPTSPEVYDQLVKNEVTVGAAGANEKGQRFSFSLELAAYPDFPDASICFSVYRSGETEGPPTEQGEFSVRKVELEALSLGIAELVRVAKERGFLAEKPNSFGGTLGGIKRKAHPLRIA